jgi:DNA-binding NtrC family response regulator
VQPHIVIFAVDRMRGGITRQILRRDGYRPLWIDTIPGMRSAIVKQPPDLLIVDTHNALPEEIASLRTICARQPGCILVLGKDAVIDTFNSPTAVCLLGLADPLDPEWVIDRVKHWLSETRRETGNQADPLEDDLKQFLGLD